MAHGNYEQAKKNVFRGMWLLAFITLAEVAVSLFGKGYLGIDPSGFMWVVYLVGLLLIVLSLYKAYFIVYEFMHMGHEVRDLRLTVLLPMLLLVWAVIAFFQEGDSWGKRRTQIKKFDTEEVEKVSKPSGMKIKDEETKELF